MSGAALNAGLLPPPGAGLVLADGEAGPGRNDEGELDLGSYLRLLLASRWLIVAVTLLGTLAAGLYALRSKPVYEASMLIHVEEVSPNASKNILSEVSSLFETKKAAIGEMEMLRSRAVTAPAVDKLRLYIDVEPKYFPLVGSWIAAQAGPALSQPGLFGYGGYAWGGERLQVSVFELPTALQGREFVLTATGPGRFRVTESEQGLAFDGQVGVLLRVGAGAGPIELRVDSMAARPGARFLLRRQSRLGAIEQVQNAMLIAEQGKQSGIIEIRLQGQDPGAVFAILNQVGGEYMRQNLARQTEEAEKSLAFLSRQLPELKQQLEQSEAAYNQFRHSHGTVDLAEEARIALQQAAAVKSRRIDLLQKKTELLGRFTEQHPVLLAVNRQLREVDGEIGAIAQRIRALPLIEQEQVRLTRDIKINTDLYTALSNTAQQMRIISVGKVSNVRLVDAPVRPERPVKPNRPLIVGAGALAGLLLGVLLAFARKALAGAIDDVRGIERMLGARVVYASIPHSRKQRELSRKAAAGAGLPVLAREYPEDPAVETLRSFRAALGFAMPHFKNNIVMFTGPTEGLGKSFVSVNFAAVQAASGKRVLLIDADLRRGHLHQYFGSGRERGLAEGVAGTCTIDQIIRRQVMERLDFMPAGQLPPGSAEFLMELGLAELLATLGRHYDLVLVDAPPVLAVADPLVIGAHAGAVFLIARAGITTEADIVESVRRLARAGIVPQGILFNDLKQRAGGYGYQYQRYVNQLGYAD